MRHETRALACVAALVATVAFAGAKEAKVGAFVVALEVVLPGEPEVIYDAITGDVSDWWDHTFSENPKKFYIDARPGGAFVEIFDDSGDGVVHATVIFAQRGKLLRFDGQLGFNEYALHMVHTYQFEAVEGDSTRLTVAVHASGEIQDGWAAAVESVWHHFIIEQFKPYVESGKHLNE